MKDQIDAAIQSQSQQVKMLHVGFVISSSGRPGAIQVPADLSVGELLEILAYLPIGLSNALTAERNKPKIEPAYVMPPLGKLK